MNTTHDTAIREIEEFYIAQINSLVEEGRDALIPALAEEFDQLRHDCAQQHAA